jgi:HSP20 family protein
MDLMPTVFDRSMNRNPFRSMQTMQRQMDRFFDRFWGNGELPMMLEGLQVPSSVPSCDVDETKTHYLMSFDLPGVKREDIHVDVKNNTLMISGERKEQYENKKRDDYKSECFYGRFERSFTLPNDIRANDIEAQYSDGVLRIAVPKDEASETKQIKISEGRPSFFERVLGREKDEVKISQPH